ncbi:Acetyl-CoA biotin carboxyl carrier [gut metagenome]|uniref:Biotin carboxyl carrier protein of acetyl-CoA carboxylase n=1 Tax=gut metagenome TaxID=749906 RepID=J9CRE1_9ZZZZ
MNVEQIVELIQAVSASSVGALNYEEGGVRLSMKKEKNKIKTETVPSSSVQQELEGRKSVTESEQKGSYITSPLVGTFYAAPSENGEPFVQVGDQVCEGTVLGIVEAMKLMNEIESEVHGVIEEILVENGEPVEYGQPLFLVK